MLVVQVLRCSLVALLLSCGTASAGPWREQPHPQTSGQDAIFNGVLARSARDVWAVGYRFGVVGGALEFRSLAMRWNGTGWSQSPTLDIEGPPTTTFLEGIDGLIDSEEIWVVGWSRRPREVAKTLVQRWNGSSWSIVPSPNPSATGNYLEAVAVVSATEAWAVGSSHSQSIDEAPLALRWDGFTWQPVQLPPLAFCLRQIVLSSVTARPTGRVLATGYCRVASGGHQSFVLRWHGTRWSVVVGPKNLPGSTQLTSITYVNGNEAWAVGTRLFEGFSEPLLLHMVSGTWTEELPPAGNVNGLAAVAAAGTSLVWAVGTGNSSQPPFAGVTSLRWDGTQWTQVTVPGDFGSLRGLDVTPAGFAWAAGLRNSDSLIMARRDPRNPTPE